MQAVNEAAARKFALAVLGKVDVSVGRHPLDRVRIIITCSDGAAIERSAGRGDGIEAATPTIPAAAMILFMERGGPTLGDGVRAKELWKQCLRDVQQGLRPAQPSAALDALAELATESPETYASEKRTSADAIGKASATVTIERLPIKAARRRMVRRAS